MLSKDNQFEGFSAETVFFLKNLKENNNREWFLARKKDYNKKVLKPASDFVVEMGELLQKISPGIHADPKVNRSITRIYRDTRYASEQEPYKRYLGIWFWQGVRKVNESPGYYFELRPDQIYLSAGIKSFSRKILRDYREAVSNPKSGEKLVSIVEKIRENPDYQVSREYFKRIPEGYQLQDKREELIRFNSLLANTEMPIPSELYNRNLLKLVFQIFKDFSPIHNWLSEYVRVNGKHGQSK
ncbi:MAG TPA: DUF2461 domain-containing protein [Atribacterota bacterium]|nr:DUF2461 domain-containing protein [Atribacterota bacterium]